MIVKSSIETEGFTDLSTYYCREQYSCCFYVRVNVTGIPDGGKTDSFGMCNRSISGCN